MSPRADFPVSFRFVVILFAAALSCISSFAQQPKVLAPHKAVDPKLPYSPPSPDSFVQRSMRGGYWMTDAYTKSTVYLRNNLETSSLSVVPVLYLSNGVKVPLPAVVLETNGTSDIDINGSLAAQGSALVLR